MQLGHTRLALCLRLRELCGGDLALDFGLGLCGRDRTLALLFDARGVRFESAH